MKCSACGSRYPNSCPVCREEEQPAPETPDHDSGHLLKTLTMKPDTTRTLCSVITVTMGALFVATLACGGTVPALIVIAGIGGFAAFVGATQTPC